MRYLPSVFVALTATALFAASPAHGQAPASAVIPNDPDGQPPLSIYLEREGNTKIMAKISNTKDKDIRLLKTGTFLDKAPVMRLNVVHAGKSSLFPHIRSTQ